MKYRAIKMAPADNVAVAAMDIPAGALVDISGGAEITVNEEITAGHKIALVAVSSGSPVIRYGEVICTASRDIKAGDRVHVHNTKVEQ